MAPSPEMSRTSWDNILPIRSPPLGFGITSSTANTEFHTDHINEPDFAIQDAHNLFIQQRMTSDVGLLIDSVFNEVRHTDRQSRNPAFFNARDFSILGY